MKEITIYQCEICGKESRNKEKIEKHEIECRAAFALAKKRKRELNKHKEKFINSFSFDNLAENINIFLKETCGDSFENIHFDISYSDRISNTHSAPITGETNFSCNPDRPRGYPGFSGKITGNYSKNKKTLSAYTDSHNKFSIPGLHTGSGGGGGKSWHYGFIIFLQDFPHIEKDFEERHLLKRAKYLLTSNYDYEIKENYKI